MSKKFGKYEVIVEKGDNVSKVYTVAAARKDLAAQFEKDGGEIVRVKEISGILPNASRVREDLKKAGYTKAECTIVYNMLLNLEGTET